MISILIVVSFLLPRNVAIAQDQSETVNFSASITTETSQARERTLGYAVILRTMVFVMFRLEDINTMAILNQTGHIILIFMVLPLLVPFLSRIFAPAKADENDEPPQLHEAIPFVSNALQFMIQKQAFVARLW